MASIENFKKDRFKYKDNNQTDIYNPEFCSHIKVETDESKNKFQSIMDMGYEVASYFKFYPDLLLDVMTPKDSVRTLNLYQRVLLREIFRFKNVYVTIPRGSAKCVDEETILYTDEGMIEIGDFTNHSKFENEVFFPHNINLINMYGEVEQSDAFMHNGLKSVNSITTEEGYNIKCTNNHKLLILRKNKMVWEKSINITKDDYLILSTQNDIWGKNDKINIIDYYNENEVPNLIMKGTKECVIEYLKFIYINLGFIKNDKQYIKTKTEKMARQLQTILLNFGITSSQKKYEDNYIIEILNDGKKNEMFFYFFSKVHNIEKKKSIVCDISMPDTHSFIGNGIVNHNSFIQLLAYMLMALMYPRIKLSILAESKQQSASIIKDKYNELLEWYPFFIDEIKEAKFQNDVAEIVFQNGARISNLANAQTSKGQRRHRGSIDEAARLNVASFDDAISPIFSLRRFINDNAKEDKSELNGQLIFFTTSGYRGTSEHLRTLDFIDGMADLKGQIVFGSDWQLPVHFGLLTKQFVYEKKESSSRISFQQNYGSLWVGATTDALISMEMMRKARTLDLKPTLKKSRSKSEFVIAMDVARSQDESRNQSAFVVLELHRGKNGGVKGIDVVNIIVPKNGLNFHEQTILLKQLQRDYDAIMCVIDGNGLGKGVIDECLQETLDKSTGEVYECWSCINDDRYVPEIRNSPKKFYDLNAGTGIQTDIIVNFWSVMEDDKVSLLPSVKNMKMPSKLTENEKAVYESAYMNTESLMDEISNLKAIKNDNSKKISIVQVTKKVDKDITMALLYGLYYIQRCENVVTKKNNSYTDYLFIN